MTARADSAKAIFLDCLEIPAPEAWPAFLDEACAGDAELRAAVEKLLRARRELGTFHEQTPPTLDPPPAERPDTVIGPYKPAGFSRMDARRAGLSRRLQDGPNSFCQPPNSIRIPRIEIGHPHRNRKSKLSSPLARQVTRLSRHHRQRRAQRPAAIGGRWLAAWRRAEFELQGELEKVRLGFKTHSCTSGFSHGTGQRIGKCIRITRTHRQRISSV
jgi:hypothetical protein